MNKSKKLYLAILLLTVILVTSVYFSYAFFTNKLEEHGKLNLVVGNLDYKIESKELNDNQITVAGNSIKEMIIRVTSLNDIDSKYELYYEIKEGNNVEVLYSGKKASINDQIKSEQTKEILVTIQNKDSSSATIEFKVEGGFPNNEIVLAKGNHIDKMIESPTVSGEKTTWASSRTFTINSKIEGITKYEYYITNDKLAPSMEVKATGETTPNATIQETGTYIYFRAVDNKGNKGEWTEANNLYVDNIQPVVTIAKDTNTNTLTATVNPQTTLSGYTYSWYQIPEYKIGNYGFTVTKIEENGESYYKCQFTKTSGATDDWYYVTFPNYQFTPENTYKIHFKYRVNQISNTNFAFRHAAFGNDWGSNGYIGFHVTNKTNGWIDKEMTRSFPAQITQGATISPRFEMYTDSLAIPTGGLAKSIDFDIKDVWIEEVENTSNATVTNNLAQKLEGTGATYTIPSTTFGNRYILKVTTGAGVTGSSNTYIAQ